LAEGQRNWSTTDLECLAIIEAVRHFDAYLKDTIFTLYTDYEALATLRTQFQPRGRRARWIAELKNYQFHAKHFSGKENYMADYLLRYPVGEPLQMLEEDIRMPKFVGVVLYNKKEIWLSVRLNKLMKGSLQVVFGKADKQESITAVKREVKEETDLAVTQLQWLVNDPKYDCDIYLCDIEKFKSRRSEPNKSSAWRHYSYDAFVRLSTQRRTMPVVNFSQIG